MYEALNRRESTRKVAKQVVDEYINFAAENQCEIADNETIIKYKEMLENWKKKGQAINTIKRKLAQVAVYLKESFSFKAKINFYKGKEELRNPHEVYD